MKFVIGISPGIEVVLRERRVHIFETLTDVRELFLIHAAEGEFWIELRQLWLRLKDVVERTALTNAMIIGIFIGAMLFSLVFRSLGGTEIHQNTADIQRDYFRRFVAVCWVGPRCRFS